jgi:putative hydrolase of the HAD superfamily
MQIKAIIFDFGQVLNAPENPVEVRAERAQLAARLGLEPSDLWTYLFEGEPGRAWMTGRISQPEFWRQVLAPRGINDPMEAEAFGRAVFAHTYEMNSDMLALLEELQGHYLLAVLSNATWTEPEMRTMLANDMGIPGNMFDVVVTSNSLGTTKPDPKIYLYALNQLGVEPEEAVFTDDLANFTKAAKELGINAKTFTTPADFRLYLHEIVVLPVKSTKPV